MEKISLECILGKEDSFRYQMLDRMRSDCEYYLGNGGSSCRKFLWAGDEKLQIDYMEAIWQSFPESGKPQWLSLEQIDEYGRAMGVRGL